MSRTPVNDNPDRVVYRRGFVTRHQVSGWRFIMRRIASGVAGDNAILADRTTAALVDAERSHRWSHRRAADGTQRKQAALPPLRCVRLAGERQPPHAVHGFGRRERWVAKGRDGR
jgi:hypothetical protein